MQNFVFKIKCAKIFHVKIKNLEEKMNNFCKTISKYNLSDKIVGELTSSICKAIIAAKDNNVDIDDAITEKNIISIAEKIKNGSNVKSEMIRLINTSKIENPIKVKIIANMF